MNPSEVNCIFRNKNYLAILYDTIDILTVFAYKNFQTSIFLVEQKFSSRVKFKKPHFCLGTLVKNKIKTGLFILKFRGNLVIDTVIE